MEFIKDWETQQNGTNYENTRKQQQNPENKATKEVLKCDENL